MSKQDYNKLQVQNNWADARDFRDKYKTVIDIHQHAQAYVAAYPDYPIDGFDSVDLKTRERIRNRSLADWRRAHDAFEGHYSFLNRLLRCMENPVFLTIQLKDLGFKTEDSSYVCYQEFLLLNSIRTLLRERIQGTFWWRVEVGLNNLIHIHVVCDRDAYAFKAFAKDIYDPLGLYWYLIKGIPYTAGNLAVFWAAKKSLSSLDRKHLPRKSGTVKVPQF